MGPEGARPVFHCQPDVTEVGVVSKVTESRTDVFFEVVPSEAKLLLVTSSGPHGETDEDKGHRLVNVKILSVVS